MDRALVTDEVSRRAPLLVPLKLFLAERRDQGGGKGGIIAEISPEGAFQRFGLADRKVRLECETTFESPFRIARAARENG